MNRNMYKNLWSLCLLMSFTFFAFTSCEEGGYEVEESGKPLTIENVYLHDAQSNVPSRLVEFARLGQTIRLEGSGFLGVKKIYVNGYDVYFNTALMTDDNMVFQISSKVPVLDAEENVRNTIRLEKDENRSLDYSFEIRSAAPTISNISHTMPQAGEKITITGTALMEIESITFPGGIAADISTVVSDEDGRWVEVIVPNGITESGSILIVGANGGAYSPAYFNFKEGLFHNCDDINIYQWSNGEISDDLDAVIPAEGNLPKSQGIYRSANKDSKVNKASEAQVDYGRYWLNNTTLTTRFADSGISLSTSTADCAIQMDIYYEGVWNSGNIRFVIADGWGSSRYCMIYAPWVYNGARVKVENPGCWHTITLPFSLSDDYEGLTLAEVCESIMHETSQKNPQSGPWFENGDVDGVASEDTDINIYFDNFRIVPLETPTYSDFNDEEETE